MNNKTLDNPNDPTKMDSMGKSIDVSVKEHRKTENTQNLWVSSIALILINAILLYAANKLLSWNFNFITQSFATVLPLINIMLGATIFANVIYLIFQRPLLKKTIQFFLTILATIVIFEINKVFPFNLPANLSHTIHVILLVTIVLVAIGTLVEGIEIIIKIIKMSNDNS